MATTGDGHGGRGGGGGGGGRGGERATYPVPSSLETMWGIRERPARGPKRGLTVEGIVSAGIKVALTEGIAGVSMSRVAAELGAATMSLYRYVSAKDELLMLMVDAAMGPPPEPVDDGWRAGLTRWAVGARASYRRHPWGLRVPISGPPIGPNMVAWLDNGLHCLARTALSEQQKLSTVLLISGFVRNEAVLTADLAAAAGGEKIMPGYGATLQKLIGSTDFPALRRAIASGSLDDDDDLDVEFDFGLERILDGIAALIDGLPDPPNLPDPPDLPGRPSRPSRPSWPSRDG